jgi:serine/threonine-protein kinase
MGMIYLAHDPLLDRKVAIKLVRTDLLFGADRADYLARFQREAQAAGRCAHANIVSIYDFAIHDGNPYFAMEYIEGANLSQALARVGPFKPATAVLVVGQVLDALACAHGFGIVHRDVKPSNVLLLPDRRVKMTDFGISRIDTSGLTQTGSIIGTPSYMSPEQCCGDRVDARSDLFSTGVVLYELLSGARPFAADSPTATAFRIVNEPPPDLRTLRADLPASLVAVVERALAKQPDDRFPSAAVMAVALRQSVASPAVTADHTVVPARARVVFTDTQLATLERKLAQHVGPIARILVQNAARQAGTLDELHEVVARAIDHPEQRSRFRQDLGSSMAGRTAGSTASRSSVTPAQAQQAEGELIAHLGPIARILVKRALEAATSADDFWQRLSAHIEREPDRQAFLNKRRM